LPDSDRSQSIYVVTIIVNVFTIKVSDAQNALKLKLEPWGISTWKKTNWRFSVRRTWRMFVN